MWKAEKQKEQKPVISDEAIREGVARFGITQYQIDYWLKKHINVVEQKPAECWRPSIEQMAMLRAVINDKHNMASASANLALNSLYDDLIKL